MPYVDPATALNRRTTTFPTGPLQADEPWSRLPLVGSPGLRVVHLTMRWGDKTIPHYHPRGAEFFYILSGSADLWIGDGPPAVARPGDFLYAAPGVVHAIVAGRDGVRLLAGMGPNDNEPDEQVEVEIEGYPT